MDAFEEIERNYVTVPQIAEESGVDQPVVHRWARYFRYFEFSYLLGKPLVKRADYEKFKVEHPELMKPVAEARAA